MLYNLLHTAQIHVYYPVRLCLCTASIRHNSTGPFVLPCTVSTWPLGQNAQIHVIGEKVQLSETHTKHTKNQHGTKVETVQYGTVHSTQLDKLQYKNVVQYDFQVTSFY